MERTALASFAGLALVLILGLVGVGLVVTDDHDDRMGGERRDGAGASMMSGGHLRQMMRQAVVRSEGDYLVEMVAHHEDAIEAASGLSRSERPRMRALGASIVASQSEQVARMNAWLDEWYPEAPDPDYEPMMSDLGDLSGDRLDRVFLRDMIPHHMTAVMASQHLLVRGLARHDEVADLARTIRDDQSAEIRTMSGWLRSWFGGGTMMGRW